MPQISTRASSRAELTHKQVDDNFINLNIAVTKAQTTADQALEQSAGMPSLKETSGRVRVSPLDEADDGVHNLQVNGSVRVSDRTSLGGSPGAESLRVNVSQSLGQPSGRIDFTGGSAAAMYPRLQAVNPSTTDASISYGTQGAGVHRFWTSSVGGLEQVRIAHTASAVSYLKLTGGATGAGPTVSPDGAATAISLQLSSKGGGNVQFFSNSSLQAQITGPANAANLLGFSGSTTGNAPSISVAGTDTNINLELRYKGTGSIRFLESASGREQFRVNHTANAVNYVQVSGAAAGLSPTIAAVGSDTAMGLIHSTKGSGEHVFTTGGGVQFRVINTASGVNYPCATAGVTGGPAKLTTDGPDTNIDILLSPKGTGNVRFGAYTATTDITIGGYITIKDAGGNVRKLAVLN